MKCRKNYILAMAVAARWLSTVAIPARAFQYGCAAERDERNGLPYTAAMQWRKAAELFPPDTLAAEYFWSQWERVMQLPRRLSGPIEDCPSPARLELVTSAPPTAKPTDELSLSTAA
ncbi:MAG TPA: hypothetical protein VD837_04375 [Terriglobales bacterium]|nr:hypothetical protein [Terriglobales bacterium]